MKEKGKREQEQRKRGKGKGDKERETGKGHGKVKGRRGKGKKAHKRESVERSEAELGYCMLSLFVEDIFKVRFYLLVDPARLDKDSV